MAFKRINDIVKGASVILLNQITKINTNIYIYIHTLVFFFFLILILGCHCPLKSKNSYVPTHIKCHRLNFYLIYCGAKEFGNPGPFHIKTKAHAEEEEMFEDERRRSKLPGDLTKDNPVLDKLRSRKEKAAHHQG